MFDSLSDRLNDVFDRLRRHGALTEDDVGAAMREIRVALLEADVALPVVRDFVDRGAREGGRPGGAALGDAGRRWSSRSCTTTSSRCSAADAGGADAATAST